MRRQVRVTMLLTFDPRWPVKEAAIRKMVETNEAFDPKHDQIEAIEIDPAPKEIAHSPTLGAEVSRSMFRDGTTKVEPAPEEKPWRS